MPFGASTRSRSYECKRRHDFPIKIDIPELAECQHFEENNSKNHNGMLILAQGSHVLMRLRSENASQVLKINNAVPRKVQN